MIKSIFFFLVYLLAGHAAPISPYAQKTILITGGAGSIGAILVEDILKQDPKQVLVYSRDELKHFLILEKFQNDPRIKCIIGDVRDFKRLLEATKRVDLVIHSAALKRINAIEENVEEAFKTNVLGTLNVLNACVDSRVSKAVLISTDKACLPVSAYGASKLMAEKIFTNYDKENSGTQFSVVRFGNLVGSSGSILPIFLEKIQNGEEIPLTDSSMTRFMMTGAQIAETVRDAFAFSAGGEIFIRRMPSVRIADLIDAIKEKTQSENKVKIIGIRPGERINEILINETEIGRAYLFKDYYIITPLQKAPGVHPLYVKNGVWLDGQDPDELHSERCSLSLEAVRRFVDSF